MHRASARGEGKIGCIIGLVILAIVVIIGVKAIPAKIAVAEMRDFCEREAESASLPRHDNEWIQNSIAFKAQELRLPIKREDISVTRGASEVHIQVKYMMVLEFPFYTYDWPIEHKVDRPLF